MYTYMDSFVQIMDMIKGLHMTMPETPHVGSTIVSEIKDPKP